MAGKTLQRKKIVQNKSLKPDVVEKSKKEIFVKKSVQNTFQKTKQYFVFAEDLIDIVRSAQPSEIKVSKKDRHDRVNWRKFQLEQKIKEINESSLSRPEKEDLIESYTNWIKNFDNLLKKIKEEK